VSLVVVDGSKNIHVVRVDVHRTTWEEDGGYSYPEKQS
jgi:hypothetical protein